MQLMVVNVYYRYQSLKRWFGDPNIVFQILYKLFVFGLLWLCSVFIRDSVLRDHSGWAWGPDAVPGLNLIGHARRASYLLYYHSSLFSNVLKPIQYLCSIKQNQKQPPQHRPPNKPKCRLTDEWHEPKDFCKNYKLRYMGYGMNIFQKIAGKENEKSSLRPSK